MEGENIYDKIQELFGESPGTLSILEEKVDIDLQMEYFEYSRSVKKNLDEKEVMQEMRELYDPEWSDEQKKNLFARLASIERVEAYRFIENYLKEVIKPNMIVPPYDERAAEWHAKERARLSSMGDTPAFVDGQIASIARMRGLILVTRNTAVFKNFSNLELKNWHRK